MLPELSSLTYSKKKGNETSNIHLWGKPLNVCGGILEDTDYLRLEIINLNIKRLFALY